MGPGDETWSEAAYEAVTGKTWEEPAAEEEKDPTTGWHYTYPEDAAHGRKAQLVGPFDTSTEAVTRAAAAYPEGGFAMHPARKPEPEPEAVPEEPSHLGWSYKLDNGEEHGGFKTAEEAGVHAGENHVGQSFLLIQPK